MDGAVALGRVRNRVLTVALRKMTVRAVRCSSNRPMAGDRRAVTVVSDDSIGEFGHGATDMNLSIADLMVQERMNDLQRDLETSRLLALARGPRAERVGWRERVGRAAERFRVMRRGTAT